MSPIGPTLIFGTTSLLAGLLIPLLPETKNKTSPDTIQVRARLEKYTQFVMTQLIIGGRGILQAVQQVLLVLICTSCVFNHEMILKNILWGGFQTESMVININKKKGI